LFCASVGQFAGLTAVEARRVAYRFADAYSLPALRWLLASKIPEHRFVALEMLVLSPGKLFIGNCFLELPFPSVLD